MFNWKVGKAQGIVWARGFRWTRFSSWYRNPILEFEPKSLSTCQTAKSSIVIVNYLPLKALARMDTIVRPDSKQTPTSGRCSVKFAHLRPGTTSWLWRHYSYSIISRAHTANSIKLVEQQRLHGKQWQQVKGDFQGMMIGFCHDSKSSLPDTLESASAPIIGK